MTRSTLMEEEECPFRDAIAAAISQRELAAQAARAAAEELARFDDRLASAVREFYAADNAVSEAKKWLEDATRMFGGDERAAVEHCLRIRGVSPRDAITKAEERLAKATERRRAAKNGREELEAKKAVADEALRQRDKDVEHAIFAFEQRQIPALLLHAEALQDELNAKRAVIHHLSRSLAGDMSDFTRRINTFLHDDCVAGPNEDVRADIPSIKRVKPAALAPWLASREALKTDPEAPLPA